MADDTGGRYTREGAHPVAKALLEQSIAARPMPRVLDAEAMRANDAALVTIWNVGAPEVPYEREITVPGPAGDLRTLLWGARAPSPDALMPAVLYLHGGGFTIMLPETTAKLSKHLAVGAGALVVGPDYRLAPEAPYPAALDDCVAVYRWLREHAADAGGDPERIIIAGDSAGGNLAAAATLRLIAEGERPPDAVLLVCAWLDVANETPSFRAFGPDDGLIDDVVMEHWRHGYVADRAQWANPYVSPLRGDLRTFPPTCVVVGGIDPLYDDGVLFAEKLRAAGRDVALHEYAGMPHEFIFFPVLDTATDAIPKMQEFVRRYASNG